MSLIAACLLLAALSSSETFLTPGSVAARRPSPSGRGGVQPATTQTDTACAGTLSPTTTSVSAGGGTGTVTVNTQQVCPWTTASVSDWSTITSATSGEGAGPVGFMVAPTSAPRAGRLEAAGQNFAVYREFDTCGTPLFSVSSHDVGYSSDAVQAADLNGDGRTDLVFTNQGVAPSIRSELSVLLSDGSGRFNNSKFDSGLSAHPTFDLGDFDGDGRPDVAMTTGSFIRIFFNDGFGGFGRSYADIAVNPDLQVGLYRPMSADMNRDGRLDLVIGTAGRTASGTDTTGALILVGDGAGGFTQTAAITVDPYGILSGVADTDSDGALDLLFPGGPSDDQRLTVMRGDGRGGFGAPLVSAGIAAIFPRTLAVADFDTDGRLDVVALGINYVPSPTPTSPRYTAVIQILSGDGAGRFTQKSLTESQPVDRESALVVADFNNDAKADVAYSTGRKVTVRLGDGAGGLGAPLTTDTGGASGIYDLTAGDFDGDSRPDLAGADYDRGAVMLKNHCSLVPHISGHVTDRQGGRALVGVTVALSGAQSATTQTDEGGNYYFGGLTAGADYVLTPSKEYYRFAPASATVNVLAGGQVADFAATAMTVQFSTNRYEVDENASSVSFEVFRDGDTSGPATVDYTAGDDLIPAGPGHYASERSDYTYAAGTLRFAPGETTKNFTVLLNDDKVYELNEVIVVRLSDPSGAILVWPFSVGVLIIDDDGFPETENPLSDSQFFVRQHYHDFLNREADAPGLAFWTNEIESCGSNQQCREVKRINVSAAFFLSIEFQETGFLAYRTYAVAFGTRRVGGVVPLTLHEFLPDTQEVSRGVVIGQPGAEALLEANKQAYFNEFVMRPQFLAAYPPAMTPGAFVDALNANTSGSLTPGEAERLAGELGDGTKTRADVLWAVAEGAAFRGSETRRAFVLMQYYGYLRRNPNDAPQLSLDFDGYNFWLQKLDDHGGDFVAAEMVKAFLTSAEYRQRFGP